MMFCSQAPNHIGIQWLRTHQVRGHPCKSGKFVTPFIKYKGKKRPIKRKVK